ncbi:hypothetical protein BCON_0457g00020 [Botryotinia convoluta]|uniref:Uncharacterized protein n=1 Tax=Botryotinia convoluta TaxID=54673 RepID=A0A4Z1H6U7_9HELO|nr:hypothetical protein BCON_0457g00020 [Botryotinia convoluta]
MLLLNGVKSALVDCLSWVANVNVEDGMSIMNINQRKKLKDTIYVSVFEAVRVAKKRIDEPRPPGCNTEEAQCTRSG